MARQTNRIAAAGAHHDQTHPLQTLVESWMAKIKSAFDHKKAEFQDDADEAMRFFDGPYDFMYKNETSARGGFRSEFSHPSPSFRMTYNRVAEMVQLFGPVLYHNNPQRQVTPRKLPVIPAQLFGDPKDPQVQQQIQAMTQQFETMRTENELRATLMQTYLNYTPNEMNLKEHSRQAIDEAIIKGLGVLWTEVFRPPGADFKMIRSVYDTVDNLLIDPDMETIEDALWVARRRVAPTWAVEKKFQLHPGTLSGNLESYKNQSLGGEFGYYRQRGDTNDLVTYWEIFSRMGMGHKLKENVGSGAREYVKAFGPESDTLDKFGNNVFLAVCADYPFFLNLPEKEFANQFNDVFHKVQWPIPFWSDPTDPWPFVPIQFHRRPRKVWPMSHVKPGLGELKFLNWALSFIADKIKNTSRDFLGVLKSAGEDLKTQLLSGGDLTLLEIERQHGKTIDDVVSFLQHPQMNGDIWKVIDAMMKVFEDRVGLNELMYGESKRQLRSAAEANVKSASVKIRPDDMATKVEEAMTLLSRKEALAARWFLEAKDLALVVGPTHAALWTQYVQTEDVAKTVAEFEYRIEANSIRKPNRDRDVENANQAMQNWTPLMQSYFQATGDVRPINALISMWAKAYDLDPKDFVFQPPEEEEGPSPEEQQMQMEGKKNQMEMATKQQEAQLDAMKKSVDIRSQEQKSALESQKAMQEMIMGDRKAQLELAQDNATHQLEMAHMVEKMRLEKMVAASKSKDNGAK